jgi:hypothetical protein
MQATIGATTAFAAQALGLVAGQSTPDCVNDEGVRIIEIAGRSIGGQFRRSCDLGSTLRWRADHPAGGRIAAGRRLAP